MDFVKVFRLKTEMYFFEPSKTCAPAGALSVLLLASHHFFSYFPALKFNSSLNFSGIADGVNWKVVEAECAGL